MNSITDWPSIEEILFLRDENAKLRDENAELLEIVGGTIRDKEKLRAALVEIAEMDEAYRMPDPFATAQHIARAALNKETK